MNEDNKQKTEIEWKDIPDDNAELEKYEVIALVCKDPFGDNYLVRFDY